jgi:hypothetical protein
MASALARPVEAQLAAAWHLRGDEPAEPSLGDLAAEVNALGFQLARGKSLT